MEKPAAKSETAATRQPERQERELPRIQAATPQRGIAVSSLNGDLKLVSTGDSVKVSVDFRALPSARRNSPAGRSEARQLQGLAPICAKGPEGTNEAVIEKAQEGVYVFSAESLDATPAQARFTLKIYELRARKKVAELGRRSITQKSVLAKVLMPEAVLWDDESAFTGSIQDGESTTKFNAQTGVYWKEYE